MKEKDICEWLRRLLKDGPLDVAEVRLAAKAAGYKKTELRRAREQLGVITANNWSENHPFTDHWFWSLPGDER